MSVDLEAIARQLLTAEETRKTIEPLTSQFEGFDVDTAYRVQLLGVKMKVQMGRKVVGKKIGLTSRGMQQLLGVNEPDYGHILDHMVLFEGQPCPRDALIQPKVEGEIAFVLGKDLVGPGVNVADVFRATEYIVPAIEIVDSRIRDWKIKLADTVADNASSALVCLGGKVTPPEAVDLRLVGMLLERNGVVVHTGAGAEVWGHPAAAVAWLANKLSEYGIKLEAGEIILSGAFTAAVDASQGDVFRVSFDRLGAVTVRFV